MRVVSDMRDSSVGTNIRIEVFSFLYGAMCSETKNIRLGKTSNKWDRRIIFSMLEAIPARSIKFQHPINIRIPRNVMILTVRVFEAESEEIIRKSNVPCVKDFGHKCFMYALEGRMNEVARANGLSDGEDHMSHEPRVSIGWFL